MSAASAIALVRERLGLARWVLVASESLRDPSLIVHEGSNGWTHPYLQNDALVTYLLLTCFDVLGQPADWKDFGAWLGSGSCAGERDAALAAVPAVADHVRGALALHQTYNRLYGMRSSFDRFIDNLAPQHRTDLLESVTLLDDQPEDAERKRRFIRNARNSFTHKAVAAGSPDRVIGPDVVMLEGGKVLWGERPVFAGLKVAARVRRWPYLLFELLDSATGGGLQDFEIPLQVHTPDHAFEVRWPYSRLRDHAGLAALAVEGRGPRGHRP